MSKIGGDDGIILSTFVIGGGVGKITLSPYCTVGFYFRSWSTGFFKWLATFLSIWLELLPSKSQDPVDFPRFKLERLRIVASLGMSEIEKHK